MAGATSAPLTRQGDHWGRRGHHRSGEIHIIVYSHLHKNPFQIFLKITSVMGASNVSDKKLNSEIENVFEKLFLNTKEATFVK